MKGIQLRILSTVLAATILCGMVPVTAAEETPMTGVETDVVTATDAVEEVDYGIALLSEASTEVLTGACGDDLTWALTDTSADGDGSSYTLTITGTGATYDWYCAGGTYTPWYEQRAEITELVIGEGMTHVGQDAFLGLCSVTELNLPTTLVSVGESSFKEMYSVKELNFPASLTTIGHGAFMYCTSLTELIIPDTVTSVGEYAFQHCYNVTHLSIGNGLRSLAYGAFDTDGSLNTIYLSAGVRSIDPGAFESLTNLVAFTVDSDNPEFCTDANGVLYSKDMTRLVFFPGRCLPEGVSDYTIPAHVTYIGDRSFQYNSSIQNLTVPATVQHVGENAFHYSGLVTVELLGGGWIWDYAFANCGRLESVHFGSGVDTVFMRAFYKCTSLEIVTMDEGVTSIGEQAFCECSALKEVTIPSSVTTIGEKAFCECTVLSSVTILNGLQTVGDYAFYYCKALTEIKLPSSVTRIGKYAFSDCSALKKVELSEGLTTIDNYAFCNCKLLSAIEFPSTLMDFGKKVFSGTNLQVAIFRGPAPGCYSYSSTSNRTFLSGTTVYYPFRYDGEAVDDWTTAWSAPSWRGYTAYPVMGDGDLEIRASGYYAKLKQRHITFVSKDDPVYNVTMTVGEASVTADEYSDCISAVILAEEGQTADFTREGRFAASLPCELLSNFNTVEMYPTTMKEPFVQAAYGRLVSEKATGNWNDLLHTGMTLTAASETEQAGFYVDVNWNGMEAGKIILAQNSDGIDGWELALDGGYSAVANYGPKLCAGQPMYLVLETADGQRFVQKLQITVKQPQIELDLSTIPDIDIGAPEGDAGAHFVGFDLGIDLSDSVKLTFSVREDGTLMGMLGFTPPDNPVDEEVVFNQVKECLTSAGSGEDTYSLVEQLVKQYGGMVNAPKSAKMMVKVENQILGYIEGKYVQQADGTYKPVFTEGAIAIKVAGEASYVYQSYLPAPVATPFYIKPSMGASMQLTLPVLHSDETGKLEAQPVQMTIEVPLRLAGGLGWESILSVGIYGEGKAAIEGEITNTDSMVGYLQAKFGAEAAVFGFSADVTIAETEPWYFLGAPQARLLAYQAINETIQNVEWEAQSRDYLNAPSLGDVQLMNAEEEEDTILMVGAVTNEAIYPYADVQVATASNGNKVAVWVEDDPNRAAANRTVLYYSVYDIYDQAWSTPAAVKNDGTADFEPVLTDVNGTIYLVWKNASRALTEEDTVATIPAVIDLQCAEFRASRSYFYSAKTMGSEYYDTCATMAYSSNGACVVWVSAQSNDVFGSGEATYSIYRQLTSSSTPELLASGLSYIDGLAANGDEVWFTADTDGDCTTVSDRELFRIAGGAVTRITNDTESDTDPTFVNGTLTWFRNGTLYRESEGSIVSANCNRYCYAEGDGVEAILYVQDDAVRKSTLYASFNDGTGWGEPMVLTGITGNIGSLDASFASDGSLSIIACERVLDGESDNYLADAAYLRHYTLGSVCNLAVNGVSYVAQTMIPDGELTLMVDVTNQGMSQIQMIKLTAAYETTTAEPVILRTDLASGESTTLFFNLPLPTDLSTMGEISVTVEVMNQEESVTTDNSAATTLRLCDLSVECAKAVSNGETTKVTVLVGNRGRQELSSVSLQVLNGEVVLAESQVDVLAADDGQFVVLEIEQGMEDLSLLTVRATADGLEPEQENISSNNQLTLLVDGTKQQVFSVVRTATATETGAIAQMEIHNGTQENQTCILYAAAYDQFGQMKDAMCGVYETLSGESKHVTMPLEGGSDVTEVRIFLLDAEYVPTQMAEIISVR